MSKLAFISLAFLISFSQPGFSNDENLKPFCSDACTGFPNGTAENPIKWRHCCYLHDLQYWAGGNYTDRLEADLDLRKCVAETGESVTADIMFAGVRNGGTPFLDTPFRWGYGWPYLRGYRSLTSQEFAMVQANLPPDPLNPPRCEKKKKMKDQESTSFSP